MKIEKKITIPSAKVFRIIGEAGKASRLLGWVIDNMNPNDYIYNAHAREKQYIANELGIDPTTINGMLTVLVNHSILYRVGKGMYRINKEFIHIEYPNYKKEPVHIPETVANAGKTDKRRKNNKVPNQLINYGAINEELMKTEEQITDELLDFKP